MQSDTPRTDANTWATGEERLAEKTDVVDADFARQLERELAAAIKQRDEARENLRDACEEIAMRVNSHSMLSTNKTAEYIAAERGWDCFGEKQGGGA